MDKETGISLLEGNLVVSIKISTAQFLDLRSTFEKLPHVDKDSYVAGFLRFNTDNLVHTIHCCGELCFTL